MAVLPPRRDRTVLALVALAGVAGLVAAVAMFSVLSDDGDAGLGTVEGEQASLDVTPRGVSDDLFTTEVIGFDDSATPFGELVGDGTPTVVNFFASWCAPCRIEMPAFEQVAGELDGEVAFLGLAVNDRPDDARRTVEDTGVTYDVARDRDGSVLNAVGGVAMPTTAFVDADGRVVEVHSGELDAEELRELIEKSFGP